MAHQNVSSSDATAQNAVTDRFQPNEQARSQRDDAREEPRAYAAPEAADASLAPPAAGETADFMDEGEDLGGAAAQQGRTHANRPETTEARSGQGPKTTAANRDRLKDGDAG